MAVGVKVGVVAASSTAANFGAGCTCRPLLRACVGAVLAKPRLVRALVTRGCCEFAVHAVTSDCCVGTIEREMGCFTNITDDCLNAVQRVLAMALSHQFSYTLDSVRQR
eukprot:m.386899 g.386899  ORF g.386899 m.386899 type:complete len:109 (-) comp21026_c0_seq4:210-536(-)